MGKRKKQVVFDPDCKFDCARVVSEVLARWLCSDQRRIIRWAMDDNGHDFPIQIERGAP